MRGEILDDTRLRRRKLDGGRAMQLFGELLGKPYALRLDLRALGMQLLAVVRADLGEPALGGMALRAQVVLLLDPIALALERVELAHEALAGELRVALGHRLEDRHRSRKLALDFRCRAKLLADPRHRGRFLSERIKIGGAIGAKLRVGARDRVVGVAVPSRERHVGELGVDAPKPQRGERELALQRTRFGLGDVGLEPHEHFAGDDKLSFGDRDLANDSRFGGLYDLEVRARREPPFGDGDDVELAQNEPQHDRRDKRDQAMQQHARQRRRRSLVDTQGGGRERRGSRRRVRNVASACEARHCGHGRNARGLRAGQGARGRDTPSASAAIDASEGSCGASTMAPARAAPAASNDHVASAPSLEADAATISPPPNAPSAHATWPSVATSVTSGIDSAPANAFAADAIVAVSTSDPTRPSSARSCSDHRESSGCVAPGTSGGPSPAGVPSELASGSEASGTSGTLAGEPADCPVSDGVTVAAMAVASDESSAGCTALDSTVVATVSSSPLTVVESAGNGNDVSVAAFAPKPLPESTASVAASACALPSPSASPRSPLCQSRMRISSLSTLPLAAVRIDSIPASVALRV